MSLFGGTYLSEAVPVMTKPPEPVITAASVHASHVHSIHHETMGHSLGSGHEIANGILDSAGHALLAGATILGAAGLAVVVTRAVVRNTERLARGVDRLDRELADLERRYVDACEAAALWENMAEQVVEVNARLAVLRGAARRGFGDDPDLPIPPPLAMGCRSLSEIADECARRRDEIDEAWAEFDLRAEKRARDRLAMSLPDIDPSLLPTAEELLARTGRPAPPVRGNTAEREAARRRTEASVLLEEFLAETSGSPIVSARDRARLLETAAKAGQPTNGAPAQLDLLARRIAQLRAKVRRHHEDALLCGRLLEGIEYLNRSGALDETDLRVVAELNAVIEGDDTLAEEVRGEAIRLAGRASTLAEQHRHARRLAELLKAEGYEVTFTEATGPASPDRFQVSLAGWNKEHYGDVIVDGLRVKGQLVGAVEATDSQARLRSADHCKAFHDSMAEATRRLEAEGTKVTDLQASLTEVQARAENPGAALDEGAEPAQRTHDLGAGR
ncbi:hypothetical protein ABGB12_34280 [Actinocorallia sp. B10E7]|uniref:hypothetical protein n=1 Tax=Actinocorallia sp. B10E7 TaxID=3153558 RepID=UPI00325DB62B